MKEDDSKIYINALSVATAIHGSSEKLIDCSNNKDGAFVQGEAFSSQAKPRESNPYPKHTQAHEWFDAGWSNDLDELTGI